MGRQLQTHCLNGHLLADPNLYYFPRPNGHIGRWCRTCHLATNSRWQKRHRVQNRSYHREWQRNWRITLYLARDLQSHHHEVLDPIGLY